MPRNDYYLGGLDRRWKRRSNSDRLGPMPERRSQPDASVTSACIVFVTPGILGAAGMNFGAVMAATALAAGIAAGRQGP